MHIFELGILFVFLVYAMKVWTDINPKLKRVKQLKKLEDIGNIDKIYRFIQYSCMLIVGDNRLTRGYCTDIQYLQGVFKWVLIQQADKLRKIIRNIRKVIKFIRGPKFIINLLKKKIRFPQKEMWSNKGVYLTELFKFLQVVSKALGEICLILFYLTDHHESFYDLGLLKTWKNTADQIGDFGLTLRMWFSVLVIVSLIFNKISRAISMKFEVGKKQTIQSIASDNLSEIAANLAQVFLFYGLVHQQFMCKTNLAALGVLSCCLKLGKIFI